jgi:DNA-binding MarR family transcriptional regulator
MGERAQLSSMLSGGKHAVRKLKLVQILLARFFRLTPPSVHHMVLTLERVGLISRRRGRLGVSSSRLIVLAKRDTKQSICRKSIHIYGRQFRQHSGWTERAFDDCQLLPIGMGCFRWEIWNEPDSAVANGTQAPNLTAYRNALKNLNPLYQVGGSTVTYPNNG